MADLGRLGVSKQLDVRMDDDLLMQIELDEPAYVYVLALNPDGSRQLCYPSFQDSPPMAQAELKVPENADEFFGLTDGAGPQAFVVLAAKQPLPSYEEFQKRIATLPWEPFDLASPWCFNGRHFFPSVETPTERGSLRRLAPEEISTTACPAAVSSLTRL